MERTNPFIEGDRILIKLNSGENFEGDFVRGTDNRIEIDNIHHYESGNKIQTTYSFYQCEIDSVFKLNNKKSSTESHNMTDTKCLQREVIIKSILISREEYERLKNMTNNYIFIKTDDKTFYDAVDQISNFESIGVFAVDADKGRCNKISLIAISTWKQVYIFDLKSFRSKNCFPIELAEILESFYIKKVVHNGGTLVDCLKYSHGIIMNNIFDTQVAHLCISKKATGECPKKLKNIGECLTEYFNFSPTLLTSSLLSLKESWKERPLDEEYLKKLSRLVTYLLTLRDHQMNLMLKKFDEAVEDYHNLFIKSSEFQVMKRSSSDECTKDIEKIIPNL